MAAKKQRKKARLARGTQKTTVPVVSFTAEEEAFFEAGARLETEPDPEMYEPEPRRWWQHLRLVRLAQR